jgi:hypothetical protein
MRFMRASLLIIAVVTLLTVAAGDVLAVDCGGSIPDAAALIAAINSATSGDTITLEAGCTYTLTVPDNGSNGLPIIDKTLTFEGNGATIERSSDGGTPEFIIIWVEGGDLTVNNLTFANGLTGIYSNSSTVLVANSTVKNMIYEGIINYLGNLTVTNSTIANNGSSGIGIHSTGSTSTTVTNSTITGNTNTTANSGGGIGLDGGDLTVINSTIANNSTTILNANGGGIYFDNAFGGTVTLRGTVVAGNSATSGGNDIYGDVISDDYNLIQDTSGASITGTTTNNIYNQDPLLGALQDNGGLTETMLPLPLSPGIDAGYCTEATDQRGAGYTRVVDLWPNNALDGNGCDIGAVERQTLPPMCPDGTAGDDVLVCEVSLPDASNVDRNVNAGAGNDDITILAGVTVDNIIGDEGNDTITVYGTVNMIIYGEEEDDLFVFKPGFGAGPDDSLWVYGSGGYDVLNVDIPGLDQATMDALQNADPTSDTVVVNGITLELYNLEEILVEGYPPNCNGPIYDSASLTAAINAANVNGQPDVLELVGTCRYTLQNTLTIGDDGAGNTLTIHGNGAIIERGSTTRIFDVQPSGDLAIDHMTLLGGQGIGALNSGGGLYVLDGTVDIDNVIFSGSTGDWGTALTALSNSTVTVSNSSFTNNAGEFGGAIFNDDFCQMTLTNVSMSNNTALDAVSGAGGAIYNNGRLDIVGGNFQTNSARLNGGFMVNTGEVTITGATIDGHTTEDDGGAFYLYPEASLTLINSTVSNSTTTGSFDFGGAIYGDTVSITLQNSTISDSHTTGYGGAIYAEDSIITIENGSALTGNTTIDIAGLGGAVYSGGLLGQLVISDSLIDDNSADLGGGGVVCISGQLTIIDSTISNNSTTGYGGGVASYQGCAATITSTTFESNSVTSDAPNGANYYGGGGLFLLAQNNNLSQIKSSTFTGNTSATDGGAIGIGDARTLTLTNNTIVGNSAQNGGGIHNSLVYEPDMQNNILGGNAASIAGPDLWGAFKSNGYNLIEDPTGATITGLDQTDITGIAPVLYALADNGGPTQTMLPLPDSPVVDAGYCTEITDQRGVGYARVVDTWLLNSPGGNGCDIGAVELQTLPLMCPDGTSGDDVLHCQANPPIYSNSDNNIDLGAGNDALTLLSGVTVNNIHAGNGNDAVTIEGIVSGGIFGENHDDTIILSAGASGGADHDLTIDGGAGFDVLNFDFAVDPATFDALALADPASDSIIIINGETFSWINFEELQVQGQNVRLTTMIFSEQALHNAMEDEIAANPAISDLEVTVPNLVPGEIVLAVQVNGVVGTVRVTLTDAGGFVVIQYLDIMVGGTAAPTDFVVSINRELPVLVINSLNPLFGEHGGLVSITMTDMEITVVLLRWMP